MKHAIVFALGAVYALALTGCGSEWSVSQAKFYKYQNHDVRLATKLALSRTARPKLGSGGADLEMRLYTGNYGAILTEETLHVGEGLEGQGAVDVSEIDTIAIKDFRLGGTPNTYQDLCAEFRMQRSNFPDWTRVGCLNYNDTPSESPTGGLESALHGEALAELP